jgi:hypothetical protein
MLNSIEVADDVTVVSAAGSQASAIGCAGVNAGREPVQLDVHPQQRHAGGSAAAFS